MFQVAVGDDGVGPRKMNLHGHLDHSVSVVHGHPVSSFPSEVDSAFPVFINGRLGSLLF